MPRGEHFKKENPRINQVSFKVSDSELLQLRNIAKEAKLSIAEWLRGQITIPQKEANNKVPEMAKVEQAEAAPLVIERKRIPEKDVIKKAKNYDKAPVQNEQMSMF